jgi:hypothetical protein
LASIEDLHEHDQMQDDECRDNDRWNYDKWQLTHCTCCYLLDESRDLLSRCNACGDRYDEVGEAQKVEAQEPPAVQKTRIIPEAPSQECANTNCDVT